MKRLAACVLIAGLCAAGCPSPSSTTAASTPARTMGDVDAIPVVVAPAAEGEVVRTLQLGGLAQAWRAARLAPSAQGVVETLNVELGDTVEKGKLLASIDTSALRLQRDAAARSIDLAAIQVTDARGEAARARELAPSGAITPRDLEKAELGLELARAQLEQARAQSAALDGQIRLAQVVAPFGGRVTALSIEQGEFFASMGSMGGPPMLVEVQALDTIKVDVAVPESDLAKVSEGMEVSLHSDAFAERTFKGEVTLVNAAATPGARTFLVRIKVPNDDGALRPGMFLRASLMVDRADGVVSVPPVAVTRQEAGAYVMVIEDNIAKRRPVTPGLRGDSKWALQGVTAGEQVVVEGQFGLPEGARVRIIGGGA
ncbi:MAG: efflux RND transporter periplasmic adaptor subunit [Deltaproteobacteria bacterium]|nr:efflux RND transporter periplasmic adaptor subunit [Deltaproteobacteria bacterium]